MKTHGGWNHRVLVVGIRWWSALVLVACPGSMAVAQILHESNNGGNPLIGDQAMALILTEFRNDTDEDAYDLHLTVTTSQKSPISKLIVKNSQFDQADFGRREVNNNTLYYTATAVLKDKGGGHPLNPNGVMSLHVIPSFAIKPKETFSLEWWWSRRDGTPIWWKDKDGNPIEGVPRTYTKPIADAGTGTGPVAVPEPGTWAMLAGLGLAGFAVGRRVHAQRARTQRAP